MSAFQSTELQIASWLQQLRPENGKLKTLTPPTYSLLEESLQVRADERCVVVYMNLEKSTGLVVKGVCRRMSRASR